MLEWKQCLLCGKRFLGSVKRKYCSKECREKYRNRLKVYRRMMRDPQFKQRSLARLLAWKEKKKREKEAQVSTQNNMKITIEGGGLRINIFPALCKAQVSMKDNTQINTEGD